MARKLILIGSGMAGNRFLDHLLKLAPQAFDIRVFNKEPVGGYNRIMLSPVLAGEKEFKDIVTHDASWYMSQGIHLHTSTTIKHIDPQQKTVTSDLGQVYPYDDLIIATGSQPVMLPISGSELPGLVSFREFRDVNRMVSIAKKHQHAVVIGGGLLGLEAAYGLQKQGMDVTVVHRSGVLMSQQMDAESGALLQKNLESRGLKFCMNQQTAAILGTERVKGVQFADGSGIPADLVVMAAGIKPNIHLAKEIGLAVNRGVLVDDQLRTSIDNIYALGECTEHRGQVYGLVAPLYEQAEVLAKTLAGEQASYEGSLTSTQLKVTGIELFSAGEFKETPETSALIYRDLAKNSYRKVVLKGNQLVGAVLFGDTTDAQWYFELLQQKTNISKFRDTLVFGQGF